ncbi:lysine N(6)-hydroxylase/L-ornithine N(5)-oxygenase family protein [Sulfitobacter sp. PR48]|uniref:lysine N(6)-hydroxylase/L-ornithine N(5)-oxygenase family protein n=1 Tax=Sulfitobacter sp. PR48 TaxID=3028383 RepID=UPI00237C3B6D|nr:lysine N(6)-hydroxylase/L-ornithine N(5)-oxygenase family protein [Sulfitobacter sp. PR48]MDD9720827.1 lysine N(6)-hydroxylase/L-ornithine N(5)-oxygenase family protein [Sulfitobacter sp. PR48]
MTAPTQPPRNDDEIYDLIGIGFGPSNLSLAIAIEEAGLPIRVKFLEARPAFAWHPGMMIPGTDMQISFLKDLVSQRNPQSRYSFLNYLHKKGRMNAFINRKTFFPSRVEFNDYLGWVAGQFDYCDYDRNVCGIEPLGNVGAGGTVQTLCVTARNSAGAEHVYHARNLVIAPGGAPKLPPVCDGLRGDDRLFHSKDYMSRVVPALKAGDRIAVVGAGQSAAEIFADLAQRTEAPQVDLILRGSAMKPSDDSPFVNEIFAPEQTDRFHEMSESLRRGLLDELSGTNYAVVDEDLICAIYAMLYEQSVSGAGRLRLRSQTQVVAMSSEDAKLRVELRGRKARDTKLYDKVVFATGYSRKLDASVLHGLAPLCEATETRRDYRLSMKPGFRPAVFVQGYSESSHGLSDTLLSVLAQRSAEIVAVLGTLVNEAQAIAAE